MKTKNINTFEEDFVITSLFKWINRHPKLSNAILAIEVLAVAWAVFNYNFTTNF